MDKEKFEKWLMEYLADSLDELSRNEFETLLQENSDYQKQFDELNGTWNQMDNVAVPEPSETMDNRFFEMLHVEVEKTEKSKNDRKSWLSQVSDIFWKPQVAYGMLLVLLGLGFGYFLNADRTSGSTIKTTVVENQETKEVHEN